MLLFSTCLLLLEMNQGMLQILSPLLLDYNQFRNWIFGSSRFTDDWGILGVEFPGSASSFYLTVALMIMEVMRPAFI